MTDNNDSIKKVYIEVTSKCNLNCRMCSRSTWFDEESGDMELHNFEKLMEDIRCIPTIETIFFGGIAEPFSHKHILPMLNTAKSTGKRVELITNGVYLTKEVIAQMLEMQIDKVWVSVDGGSPDSYENIRDGSEYKVVSDNLRRFSQSIYTSGAPTKLGLTFVAMKSNIGELLNVINMANQIKAEDLKISNVIPYSREMEKETLYYGTLSMNRFNESKRGSDRFYKTKIDMPIMDFYNEAVIPIIPQMLKGHNTVKLGEHEIEKKNAYCKFVEENSLFVKWDGEVCPCMSLLHNHTAYLSGTERKIKFCSFGSVAKNSLWEIWSSENYSDFRKRIKDFAFSPCTVCGHCSYVDTNEEDCFGNGFPTCGGCLWAEGFAQCP